MTKSSVEEYALDIHELISDFQLLKDYPELAQRSLDYFFQTLQMPTGTDVENDTIEVTQRIQLQAFLYPKYQNLITLTETIEREEAIEIYKEYHDVFMRYVAEISPPRHFETLDELAEQWFEDDNNCPGLIRLVSEVVDGKLILRKDTCLWNDAIEDLEDTELKYLICCYGDYESIRLRNQHFVMTMNHTIVEGHSYCDCVFHDTRIGTDLTHPPDEFFDSIQFE
jgi:hypothetical protein